MLDSTELKSADAPTGYTAQSTSRTTATAAQHHGQTPRSHEPLNTAQRLLIRALLSRTTRTTRLTASTQLHAPPTPHSFPLRATRTRRHRHPAQPTPERKWTQSTFRKTNAQTTTTTARSTVNQIRGRGTTTRRTTGEGETHIKPTTGERIQHQPQGAGDDPVPEGNAAERIEDEDDLEDAEFEPTPEQLQEAETLLDNRKTWLSQHAPEFDKKGRAEITEMAHGIIFSSEHTAKTAFDMALHNIRHRIKVRKTIQLDLNPSSEPDVEAPPPKNYTAPTQSTADKGKGRATDTDKLNSNKKRKKSSSAKKRKGKKKARVEDSSEAEPSSPSSSSSSSSGHSSGSEEDSTSDSDTDSSEDDDDKKWIPEKHNPQLWGALNIPDRIARKVDKGEYVDLWWFTPDSLNTEHDAKTTRKLELMDGELRVSAPTKPAAFTKDEHLSWDDFLYAVDKWTETMKMEEIGKKTRAAWDKFNYQIRKHKKRNEPCVKQALQ
ncbi:hypothetical protein CF326_g8392, partial [Tilletia indica]